MTLRRRRGHSRGVLTLYWHRVFLFRLAITFRVLVGAEKTTENARSVTHSVSLLRSLKQSKPTNQYHQHQSHPPVTLVYDHHPLFSVSWMVIHRSSRYSVSVIAVAIVVVVGCKRWRPVDSIGVVVLVLVDLVTVVRHRWWCADPFVVVVVIVAAASAASAATVVAVVVLRRPSSSFVVLRRRLSSFVVLRRPSSSFVVLRRPSSSFVVLCRCSSLFVVVRRPSSS